jgi:hypothetical protein
MRAPPPPLSSTAAAGGAAASAALAARRAELEATVWMSGWLVKQGHAFRNWRKRFFVLQGHELRYYKAAVPPPGGAPPPPPQRTIDIREYVLQTAALPRTPPLVHLLPRPTAAPGSVPFLMHAPAGEGGAASPASPGAAAGGAAPAGFDAWMRALQRAMTAWATLAAPKAPAGTP